MWLAAEGRKEAYVQGKRKEKSELAERGEICWLRRVKSSMKIPIVN